MSGRPLDDQLRAFEAQAESASAGYDAQSYARAGEACVAAGQKERGIRYYGRAVDAYLRAGRARAAAVLCRRIVGLSPGVVRARRTLTLLSVGDGDISGALEQVNAYVRAASSQGSEKLAVKHLEMMAGASDDAEFLRRVAELLRDLGAYSVAGKIESRAGEAQPRQDFASESDRWAKVLQIALRNPE